MKNERRRHEVNQLCASLPRALVSTVPLEERLGDRQAGDSYQLAPQGLQGILEMEIAGWSTAPT